VLAGNREDVSEHIPANKQTGRRPDHRRAEGETVEGSINDGPRNRIPTAPAITATALEAKHVLQRLLRQDTLGYKETGNNAPIAGSCNP